MTDELASDTKKITKNQRVQHRERRLKAALKANMAKRKAQMRSRSETLATNDVVGDDLTGNDRNDKT